MRTQTETNRLGEHTHRRTDTRTQTQADRCRQRDTTETDKETKIFKINMILLELPGNTDKSDTEDVKRYIFGITYQLSADHRQSIIRIENQMLVYISCTLLSFWNFL